MRTSQPGSFELPRCVKQIAAIEADLQQLTANLTGPQFYTIPAYGAWPIAYCLEHLILTGNSFLSKWDGALKDVPSTSAGATPGKPYSWLRRKMLEIMEPPYRMKVKTLTPFQPSGQRSKEQIVHQLLAMHQQMMLRMEASAKADTNRVKVGSPFVSWLSYPLGFSFDLALAHERRHLWQAWQVRRKVAPE